MYNLTMLKYKTVKKKKKIYKNISYFINKRLFYQKTPTDKSK